MNQNISRVIFIVILLLFFYCYFGQGFKTEFYNHVKDCDLTLFDGSPLHPRYAYLKNGNLKGLEFINHPSCGDYIIRYFINDKQVIEKIIVNKSFFTGDCGVFDSTFVINPNNNDVLAYGRRKTKGLKIKYSALINSVMIDVEEYREKVKKWRVKE